MCPQPCIRKEPVQSLHDLETNILKEGRLQQVSLLSLFRKLRGDTMGFLHCAQKIKYYIAVPARHAQQARPWCRAFCWTKLRSFHGPQYRRFPVFPGPAIHCYIQIHGLIFPVAGNDSKRTKRLKSLQGQAMRLHT